MSEDKQLYQLIEYFINQLYTKVERYGIISNENAITYNGKYKITPIGRLLNIRIENAKFYSEYEILFNDLKEYYKNDKRVVKVYICNAGTLMVDCRIIENKM